MAEQSFAAIWDMDGTLVDTAELHFAAWTRLFDELGKAFTRADFAATFGRRNPEIFQYLSHLHLRETEFAELGERKEQYYREAARQGVTLLPGARPLLEGLHAVGFKQAIGSSAPRKNLELILECTKTTNLFEAIACAEDTQRGKPDPEVFQVAAAKLGVPLARCVVFEDAVAGVQAARAAGMKCVAVTFVGHHPEAKLRAAGADLVVQTLEAVTVGQVQALLRT
jgi:beta-phosphoglucomutase